ncbi:hypothetical protein IPJ91_02455 [bacterium]|nr:MAG: hypothetical protein IPJ91_02455 [bacterium]
MSTNLSNNSIQNSKKYSILIFVFAIILCALLITINLLVSRNKKVTNNGSNMTNSITSTVSIDDLPDLKNIYNDEDMSILIDDSQKIVFVNSLYLSESDIILKLDGWLLDNNYELPKNYKRVYCDANCNNSIFMGVGESSSTTSINKN